MFSVELPSTKYKVTTSLTYESYQHNKETQGSAKEREEQLLLQLHESLHNELFVLLRTEKDYIRHSNVVKETLAELYSKITEKSQLLLVTAEQIAELRMKGGQGEHTSSTDNS
jgi:hypothetical protein